MKRLISILVVVVILCAGMAFYGCGDDKICDPGSTQTCVCPDRDSGAQTCQSDGMSWGLCEGCEEAGCSDECTIEGVKACSGDGFHTCGNYDSDECLDWSSVTNCGSEETCSNGVCSAPESCTDECTLEGVKQCSGNGYHICGYYDSDECLDWSSVTNCASGETCSSGVCSERETCTDECTTSGSTQCSGNGYQSCGHYDSDDCLDWSSIINCTSGETCSNGICLAIESCSDECIAVGVTQCSGTGYKECGYYDSDDCLDWGSVVNCGTEESCSSGSCTSPASCTDECLLEDSKQCSGNGYQTCSNYDSDDCLDWGSVTNCAEDEICEDAECIYNDTTRPIQSDWSPASSSIITTNSPSITLTLDENGDCRWSLNDFAYSDMKGDCLGDGTKSITCNPNGLVRGEEILYIACRDIQNNADSEDNNKHLNYTIELFATFITTDSTYDIQISSLNENIKWIATSDGAVFLDDNGTPSNTTDDTITLFNTINGLAYDYVESVAIDLQGGKWFGTFDGVSYFNDNGTPTNKADDSWTTYNTIDGLGGYHLVLVEIDSSGGKWFGTYGGGVSYLDDNGTPSDKSDDSWTNFTTTDGLADDHVLFVVIDSQGDKWFATESGVSYLNDNGTPSIKTDDSWTTFTTTDGLVYDEYVPALAIDSSGGKWIGTKEGVSYLNDNGTPSVKTDDSWRDFTIHDGLVDNYVWSLAIDSSGGKWFGTLEGVSHLDDNGTPINKADDIWTTYTTSNGLAENKVWSIDIDSSGGKWFGTSGGLSYLGSQ